MPGRFFNLDPEHRRHSASEVFRWGVWDRLLGRRRRMPAGEPAPRVAADLRLIRDPAGPPRLTWIGHSSFLGTIGGDSFLIDPVFSDRIACLYKRHVPAGMTSAELPPLSALLVSHSHYDHFDAPSLRAIPRGVPVVVPLGLGRWFRREGFEDITELDRWESATAGGLRVTLVPARHWSRRTFSDTNRSLWGGFVLESGETSVYHAGDTAWFNSFAAIGERFPCLTAALLPIGAYEPAWFMEQNHLNPEQAGAAFLQLGARHLVPMHWGTFQLTDEPLSEPIARIERWWEQSGPRDGRCLHVPAVGGTVVLG